MFRRLVTTLLVAASLVPVASTASAQVVPTGDYQQVLDVTFPTRPDAWFSDSYDACRDGCARYHKAADLMGEKMWPEYATVDGVVCRIDEGAEDSYGRHLTLCGDDGRRYRYLHLNNDTPGTDDGAAGLEHVYAPGIREGIRVARGQHLAYMGDSGNAEGTAPHLHLDVFDDAVVDPYGDNRINPYPSLVQALARGDVADGSVVHSDPVDRVAGVDRVETAVALSRQLPVEGDTVVVARSDDPTDALVAGPLAGVLDAPVLITHPDRLDERVLAEVRRRGAARAVVVGAAPSPRVLRALGEAGLAVERVAGVDRFGTADAVAEAVWAATGATDGRDLPIGEGHVAGDPVPVLPDLVDLDLPLLSLVVHADERRGGTVLLEGAEVAGDVAVELLAVDPTHAVERVWFRLDGRQVGEEGYAPYDLLGTGGTGERPNLLDTRELSPGTHVVEAVVRRAGGEDVELAATFTVANGGGRRALLALGEHPEAHRQWPDALMGSYLGAATGTPVLLTAPDGPTPGTRQVLADVPVTVVGGTAAIADGVVRSLEVDDRLAGVDRYGTAVAVMDALRSRDRVGGERVWAATGTNWPDAITAGPVLAGLGEPLVLVDGQARGRSAATSGWLHGRAAGLAEGVVIGGANAVSGDAARAFALDLT